MARAAKGTARSRTLPGKSRRPGCGGRIEAVSAPGARLGGKPDWQTALCRSTPGIGRSTRQSDHGLRMVSLERRDHPVQQAQVLSAGLRGFAFHPADGDVVLWDDELGRRCIGRAVHEIVA